VFIFWKIFPVLIALGTLRLLKYLDYKEMDSKKNEKINLKNK